jgi:hypothetical protein
LKTITRKFGKKWSETTKAAMHGFGFVTSRRHTHSALVDALEEAESFGMNLYCEGQHVNEQ